MNPPNNTEIIVCPYCSTSENEPWAKENGFVAVKCIKCKIVYVNPRPIQSLIDEGVETGVHSDVEHKRTAIGSRVDGKVKFYKKIFASLFDDIWNDKKKISWLDVGAGYGEIIEAISELSYPGSLIVGLEPMEPKATQAQNRGLKVYQKYLGEINTKYNFVSLVNVFSHIPDFRIFLEDIKNVLLDSGEFFLETGNIGDLDSSNEIPGELDLPDHLVFAGEKHIVGFLSEAGFSIIKIKKIRKDGIINFLKNIIKKIIGRKVALRIPYTSKYRSLLIRAKLSHTHE